MCAETEESSKEQLISMLHFLEKCDEESKKENGEPKEFLSTLRADYRGDSEQTHKFYKQ